MKFILSYPSLIGVTFNTYNSVVSKLNVKGVGSDVADLSPLAEFLTLFKHF